MPQKQKPKPKSSRLNMRVPEDLLVWVKDYASEHDTTVTRVFLNHIRYLKSCTKEKTS